MKSKLPNVKNIQDPILIFEAIHKMSFLRKQESRGFNNIGLAQSLPALDTGASDKVVIATGVLKHLTFLWHS